MVKIIKYSIENLIKCISGLSEQLYLVFYDLDICDYEKVLCELSRSLYNLKNIELCFRKVNRLFVFGYLRAKEFFNFVEWLDTVYIGEFMVSEYHDEDKVIGLANLYTEVGNNLFKHIYVNKDEGVIQVYNFFP